MTGNLDRLPADRFAVLWDQATSLTDMTARVKAEVGTPCPRWAVLARAVALRERGMRLKAMPKPGRDRPV